MNRYVCPNCLRTFLSEEKLDDPFCWKCGQGLYVITSEGVEKYEEKTLWEKESKKNDERI